MSLVFADQATFDNTLKALGTLGALGTFCWTVYTWRQKTKQEITANAAEARRSNRARILEAQKPFLERQLQLYTEVTRAAAVIATSDDRQLVQRQLQRFKELFSGELALVENEQVATAMQNFRRAIAGLERLSAPTDGSPPHGADMEREGLLQLSLNLAQACRDSLAKSWHVEAWANPDHTL